MENISNFNIYKRIINLCEKGGEEREKNRRIYITSNRIIHVHRTTVRSYL